MSATDREKNFHKINVEENDVHLEKDIEKNSRPLWITNRYVNNSCCVVIVMQIFFFLMLGLTVM